MTIASLIMRLTGVVCIVGATADAIAGFRFGNWLAAGNTPGMVFLGFVLLSASSHQCKSVNNGD
jgi:hypothetical protein